MPTDPQQPEDGGNVVAMPGRQDLPECSIKIERPRVNLCRHDRITLDTQRREVRCTDCGQMFDAFSYLLSNAATITRAWEDFRYVKDRLREKEASIEALAKEERRLKARVQTLKAKADPIIEIKGRPL